MKKVNLQKVTLILIDDSKQEVEFDYKGLANYVFGKTRDIGELELARSLYKKGEVELNAETATALKGYVQEAFAPVVQEAVNKILEEIINS